MVERQLGGRPFKVIGMIREEVEGIMESPRSLMRQQVTYMCRMFLDHRGVCVNV